MCASNSFFVSKTESSIFFPLDQMHGTEMYNSNSILFIKGTKQYTCSISLLFTLHVLSLRALTTYYLSLLFTSLIDKIWIFLKCLNKKPCFYSCQGLPENRILHNYHGFPTFCHFWLPCTHKVVIMLLYLLCSIKQCYLFTNL